jgi:hypothetical protein
VTSYIVSVKHQGDGPTFFGPFDGHEQAVNWSEGARQAWPEAAILVLPLDSPWT